MIVGPGQVSSGGRREMGNKTSAPDLIITGARLGLKCQVVTTSGLRASGGPQTGQPDHSGAQRVAPLAAPATTTTTTTTLISLAEPPADWPQWPSFQAARSSPPTG